MRFFHLFLFIASHFAMNEQLTDEKRLEQTVDRPQSSALFRTIMKKKHLQYGIFAFCDEKDLKVLMLSSKSILEDLRNMYVASICGLNADKKLMFDEETILLLALNSPEFNNLFKWILTKNQNNCPSDLMKMKKVDDNGIDVEKLCTVTNPDDPLMKGRGELIYTIPTNIDLEKLFFLRGKLQSVQVPLSKKILIWGLFTLKLHDNYTEVYLKPSYHGVIFNEERLEWTAVRWSKFEGKNIYNGSYDDEITAVLASDALAGNLRDQGEKGPHVELNFPKEYPLGASYCSKYIGVRWNKKRSMWEAFRRSKILGKFIYGGNFNFYEEVMAAYVSDTLARNLLAQGETSHKLNYPENDTDVYCHQYQPRKRNRSEDSKNN